MSALIAAAAGVAAVGCGLNQEGIPPPANQIFYPGAIAVDPQGNDRWLHVVNSNSDLRYNDGTLVTIDLEMAEARRAMPWQVCPNALYVYPASSPSNYCCWDVLDHNVLNCDERDFVQAAVKIGSFGSAVKILAPTSAAGQVAAIGPTTSRLFVGVRGNASITYVDADPTASPPTLSCATSSGFVECDPAHRVNQQQPPPGATDNPTPLTLPDEPYALDLDQVQGLLYVGHLRFGYLSAVNAAKPMPDLIGSFGSIFPGDAGGSAGVTSLTVTATGINSGRVYATSRFLPRAGAFAPISNGIPGGDLVADNQDIFLANAGDPFLSPLIGSETRGIQPIPGTNHTFLLQRTPPALVGFDTVGGQNVPSDVLEMCSGPTFLHMQPPLLGQDGAESQVQDKQLFVSCFEAGEVYVVDPYVPRLLTIIEVGRGPAGLAFPLTTHDRAYVVGFGSNNVSIIDLAVGSPTQYHVIERLGFPSPVPR